MLEAELLVEARALRDAVAPGAHGSRAGGGGNGALPEDASRQGSERAGKASRELVSRIALQVHLVGEGIKDVRNSAPIEVVVAVEPAFEKPGEAKASIAWCRQVLDMYRGWSGKRRMQLTEIGRRRQRHLPMLLISGFGAHRMLALEAGLHVLELSDDDRAPTRATARVRIGVAPLEEQSKAKLKQALKAALNGGAPSNERRAPLPRRCCTARARSRRRLAQRSPRRGARRRLRPHRTQPA